MTEKEYKKARDAIIDFKGTRVFMWIRLFFTLLAFLLSLVISGMYVAETFIGEGLVDKFVESTIGEIILVVAFILLFEPISLFSLVYHGAYSSISLGEIMQPEGAWDWMNFTNWQYGLLVIGSFILGFILLIISFKALKKTKENAGGFIWLMLILTVENLVCLQRFKLNIFESMDYSIWVYLIHAINLFSLIMCCRSVFCGKYLQNNFAKGTSLTMRELKSMQKENIED